MARTALAPMPPAASATDPSLPPAMLEVVQGNARPQLVVLGSRPIRLGREAANDVVIDDAGVSRAHAEVAYEDGDYVIRDLGSSNGTFVNTARTERSRLVAGASIQVGTTVFQFHEPAPALREAERLVLMGRSALLRALELPALAASAKRMTARVVPAGGRLLAQSAPMHGIFFVYRGALRVVERNDKGEERVVGRLAAGAHFGERALVADVAAPQALVADADACVLYLARTALEAVLRRRPASRAALARTVRVAPRTP